MRRNLSDGNTGIHKLDIMDENENGDAFVPASERVRMILGEDDTGEIDLEGILFCQLDVLCHFANGDMGWKQMARWLKYEEKVETGNRWSKPHVATTSLASLFALRQGIRSKEAVVVLDMDLKKGRLHQVAEDLTKLIAEEKNLSTEITQQIYECLMQPHKHKHRKGKKSSATANKSSAMAEGVPGDQALIYHTYPEGLEPEDLSAHKPNKRLMKKIPEGTEAANIMIGHCEFLEEPIMVFVRLRHPSVLADMTEVSLPTRFIFLAIGPTHSNSLYEYEETGRAMGTLLSDKVFRQVAYKATRAEDLVDGLEEFISGLTVLPPSIWDPATRLDPPQKTLTQDRIKQRLEQGPERAGPATFHMIDSSSGDRSLRRTGRLCGGLVADIKRRYPLYWSDIRDGLYLQCVASIVFLYFACVTPIVTFGGLMGDGTDNYLGTMEAIVSGALCGVVYALFAGQPLNIIGATGPMLVFELLLYTFATDRDMDFLGFRFWVGMWISFILFVFVLFDLSFLVGYITRFTEESFATLISVIFIYEAFKKVAHIWGSYPANLHRDENLHCYCRPPLVDYSVTPDPNITYIAPWSFNNFTSVINVDCVNTMDDIIVNTECVNRDMCTEGGWRLNGTGCDVDTFVKSVPDVFFLSVFLFLGTFIVAYRLKYFRATRFFPTFVRTNLSDFAVLLAILFCCGVDALLGLDTPKLYVPSEFKTTREDRTWIVNPTTIPWYWMILAFIPAVLATILIFLDQQITAVIVNRKEHKFKKGHGYHLDLLVLSFLLLACSAFGLPWYVASTVPAISHVRSLIVFSECSSPGDRPEMLGVREQRLTGALIHVLVGCSIFLTVILQYVPMAVLYGVFLYMGITSLTGVQFIHRLCILLMPGKYQPDHIYLRHVQTSRVHIFTCIQILCMLGMWVVKSVGEIAIFFPVMILLVCFVRKGMDHFFTQNELYWLDHILPDDKRRKKEDNEEDDDSDSDDDKDDKDDMDVSVSYGMPGSGKAFAMSVDINK